MTGSAEWAEQRAEEVPGRVTIVVPFHGVEDWIDECLDSVQAQTHGDLEILCVDDASPDGCAAIVGRRARHDTRIRLLAHDANRGLGGARNTGIRNATGEFVCFVDSDDKVAPDYAARLHQAIAATGADTAVSGLWLLEAGMLKPGPMAYKAGVVEPEAGGRHVFELLNRYRPTSCGKLFRRSLLVENDILQPEGRYYEDVSFWIEVALHSRRIAVIPERLYQYRSDRPGSIMNSLGRKHVDDRLFFLRRFDALLKDVVLAAPGVDQPAAEEGAAAFLARHIQYGFTLIDTLQPHDAGGLERYYAASLTEFAAQAGWRELVAAIVDARRQQVGAGE